MVIKDRAKRRLIANILSLFSLKGVDVLVPLLVAPYLVRVVGLEKFGLIAFSLSFAAYFSAVINYGFNITAARDIARCRNKTEEVSWIYSHTMIAMAILSLASFCVAVIAIALLGADRWLFGGAFALVVMQSAQPAWVFVGYEKMTLMAVLGAASKILYIAALFIFVKSEEDYVYVNVLYASSAATTFCMALILVRFFLGVKFCAITYRGMASCFYSGFSVFIMQVAPVLYSNSSVFILGLTAPPSVVGVYSAAMRVTEAFTTAGRLIANAFLPYLSLSLKDRHSLFSRLMLLVGGAATAFVFMLSDYIAEFLYSGGGAQVGYYLRWLSFGIFFGFVYLVYGPGYLSLIAKERFAAIISLLVSVLGFLLLLGFVPIYELAAVVSIFLISRFLLASLSFFFYLKS